MISYIRKIEIYLNEIQIVDEKIKSIIFINQKTITTMSDSDSQPEQHFNIKKISDEEQPHIRQILQKAKKILPSYDDEALYGLFKRYYSVESIFINELDIIAKRLKGDNDDEPTKNQKWISVGRQVRTKINKTKYNFLQDKQLLRRAQAYLEDKKLIPERRQPISRDNQNKQDFKKSKPTEQQSKNDYKSFRDQPEKKPNNNRKPKKKFVQKIEDNPQTTEQKPQNQKKIPQKIKNRQSQPIKQQMYKEKFENSISQLQQTKIQQHQQKNKVENLIINEKKLTAHEIPKNNQSKSYGTHKKDSLKTSPQQINRQKPAEFIEKLSQTKQITTPQSVNQSNQLISQPLKEQQKTPQTHSIATVQNFDSVVAGKNFDQACSQNTFILKFIQPQGYTQRISYVRTGDGSMKNVQIRVSGTSNQGGQKTN